MKIDRTNNNLLITVEESDLDIRTTGLLSFVNDHLIEIVEELDSCDIDMNRVDVSSECIAPLLFIKRLCVMNNVKCKVYNYKEDGVFVAMLKRVKLYKIFTEE